MDLLSFVVDLLKNQTIRTTAVSFANTTVKQVLTQEARQSADYSALKGKRLVLELTDLDTSLEVKFDKEISFADVELPHPETQALPSSRQANEPVAKAESAVEVSAEGSAEALATAGNEQESAQGQAATAGQAQSGQAQSGQTQSAQPEPADLTIAASSRTLLALKNKTAELEDLVASGQLHIHGDKQLLVHLFNLSALVDLSAENILSKYVGDVPAYFLNQAGQKALTVAQAFANFVAGIDNNKNPTSTDEDAFRDDSDEARAKAGTTNEPFGGLSQLANKFPLPSEQTLFNISSVAKNIFNAFNKK